MCSNLSDYFLHTNCREDGKSSPDIACYRTVVNILDVLDQLGWYALKSKAEKTVVLVSSVGVLSCEKFPYKLLNSYGVLDQKRKAEEILLQRANERGWDLSTTSKFFHQISVPIL